jgi:hypothetical protein
MLVSLAVAQAAGDTVSEEVTFANGNVTISGTMTLPASKGPHPAVILIGGSGP